MAGDDPNGLSDVPDHADTFVALARLGVGDDVLASVRYYLGDVRSGDQAAYDLEATCTGCLEANWLQSDPLQRSICGLAIDKLCSGALASTDDGSNGWG